MTEMRSRNNMPRVMWRDTADVPEHVSSSSPLASCPRGALCESLCALFELSQPLCFPTVTRGRDSCALTLAASTCSSPRVFSVFSSSLFLFSILFFIFFFVRSVSFSLLSFFLFDPFFLRPASPTGWPLLVDTWNIVSFPLLFSSFAARKNTDRCTRSLLLFLLFRFPS